MMDDAGTVTESAVALLRARGADDIPHPGGVLLAHLLRTRTLAIELGASPTLALAALCHAAYGTDGFAVALFDLAERCTLRAVIGEPAERLVYVYGACARRETYALLAELPLVIADRFTGQRQALDADDATDFALLTIANELDVSRWAQLDVATRTGLRALFHALERHAPAAGAYALAEVARDG
jgi:hypothetical protein